MLCEKCSKDAFDLVIFFIILQVFFLQCKYCPAKEGQVACNLVFAVRTHLSSCCQLSTGHLITDRSFEINFPPHVFFRDRQVVAA
jgi:hypothetical protein